MSTFKWDIVLGDAITQNLVRRNERTRIRPRVLKYDELPKDRLRARATDREDQNQR